jgi:Flp pilus assembly protein TadG
MAEMTISTRLKSERGAELIEFALVLPLLLLVCLGIAEFGFIFMRYEVVTNAAREGARLAVLPGYATIDVQNRVVAYATAGGIPAAQIGTANVAVTNTTVTVAAGVTVNCRRVTVNYTYTYQFLDGIATLFGAANFTVPMTAVAEMRTEGAL